MKYLIKIAVVLWLVPLTLSGQDGVLDMTFSGDGIAIHGSGLANDHARAIIQQPDGRILVAGNTFVNGNSEFGVLRMLEDGNLDLSFNTDGYTTTTLSALGDAAFDMALQTDGKIILAGQSDNGSGGIIGMVRYDADGILDESFGTGGVVTMDGQYFEIYAVTLQPDGKILLAGMTFDGVGRMLVVRSNTDGSPDLGFNSTGLATVTFGEYSVAFGIALRDNGKIVVAGYTETGDSADLALAQLNPNGSIDATFGTDGKVTTDLGLTWERFNSLALDPDGAIIAVGSVGMGFQFETFDVVVARYLANGTLDVGFSDDGSLVMDHDGGEDSGTDVALQSDGKILICGGAQIGGTDQFALTRLDQSGTLDNAFGTGGTVFTPMGINGGTAASLTMQSDGKILVAGSYGEAFSFDFGIARYSSGLPQSEEEFEPMVRLSVFPNPATEEATLSLSGSAGTLYFELWDANGRLIRAESMGSAQRIAIDVRDLAPGRYHVRVLDDDRHSYGTFMKMGG